VARNRYGWQKRAKEIARKQKSEEKMKRRQNRSGAGEEEEAPQVQEERSLED
jgi:hypothetical protein